MTIFKKPQVKAIVDDRTTSFIVISTSCLSIYDMLKNNYFRMARLSALLLFIPGMVAQSIQSSVDVLPSQVDDLMLKYSAGGMNNEVVVLPLTPGIGLGATQAALNSITIQGSLRPADAQTTNYLTSDNVAYMSCDSNINSSNISPSEAVAMAISQNPRAILLYSLVATHCNITGSFKYSSILTMTKVADASLLLSVIDNAQYPPTVLFEDRSVISGASGNSTLNTPAPTTAVAMSILYSITGIIVLLFLAIIATGALRAHRHPERYGPRGGGLHGRPRQSRAKGLARAMLETLPIVKFGDPEPAKPRSGDVELENGVPDSTPKQETGIVADKNAEESSIPNASEAETIEGVVEQDHGSNHGPDAESSSKEDSAAASNAGCSICTDDFEKGEDVRVLPCNHKYHPACIDPWLLNVSGTCPLCRVDLRKKTTEAPGEGIEEPLSPPLNDPEGAANGESSTQATQTVNITNLRNAPASERIAALRSLRAEQLANSEPDTAEQSRRAKVTNRLKEKFRIRTHAVAEPREGVIVDRRRSSVARNESVFTPGGSALPHPISRPKPRT